MVTNIQPLLTRYISGEATPDEAEIIEAWINESAQNRKEFQYQWKIIELTFVPGNYQLPDLDIEWKITENRLKKLNGISPDASYWYKLFTSKLFTIGAVTTFVTAIFVLKPFFDKEAKLTKTTASDSASLSDKKELNVPDNEPIKISKPEKNIASGAYLNRYNNIVFDFNDAPLNEVVGYLEKEYGISIKLENPDVGNCRTTSRFEHKTLTEILDIIGFTLGFKYKYLSETNSILILGNGCE